MCGECHTTDYRKGYDAAADTYATAWSEFDVGCEIVSRAGRAIMSLGGRKTGRCGAVTREAGAGEGARDGAAERRAATVGLQVDLQAAGGRAEVDACAPCHSRRHRVGAERLPGDPLLDEFMPGADARAPLSRRRPDPGRGLRIRLVPSEQNVPARRPLQRLPRSAQRPNAGDGERALPLLPRGTAQSGLSHASSEGLRHSPRTTSTRRGRRRRSAFRAT